MEQFVEYQNIIPLLAPQDTASTPATTPYMDLRNAHKAAFLVPVGAITTTSASDTYVITMQAATAETGTEAAVAFRYRLAGALGANTWGAVTTADTTGMSIASTDDNKIVWIEVDPDELAASDYRFVRLVLTDTDDMAAFLVTVIGFIQPRYKQATHISATAAASA